MKIQSTQWDAVFPHQKQMDALHALEGGSILFFPQLAFDVSPEEAPFLSPNYVDSRVKNISYDPIKDSLRCAESQGNAHDNIKNMLKRFMSHANLLVHQLFPRYIKNIQIGRTSFRPTEVAGRVSSYRKDDTRLHVDAFPATPNQGKRLLRVFTNINPNGKPRVWRVGEPFVDVAKRFLPRVPNPFPGSATLLKALRITKTLRTEYDHIMLHIHNQMKADLDYQQHVSQVTTAFEPGTTWIVQTDHVSHAAMSGQHLLEQTYYLPVNAMLKPEESPLYILEKMIGRKLC